MTDLPLTDTELDHLLGDDPLATLPGAATAAVAPPPHQNLNFFGGISVEVTLEVASTRITLAQLMECDVDSVIALDKLAGEPLDLKVNGALYARAEVVVLNGNYGLRIVEMCTRPDVPPQAVTTA